MEKNMAKKLVQETGLVLLEKGLVARTWGNISCRVSEKEFAISPSGMSYTRIKAEEVPIFSMETEEFEGPCKPSSEKKIHAAAYKTFSDVDFVIHTHQDYATAVGLVGADKLVLTDEEKAVLGEIRVAGYGLPGTKGLKKNVAKALEAGSKVVLMIHHGALICGKDEKDAIAKAEMLEDVCNRAVRKVLDLSEFESDGKKTEIASLITVNYPNLIVDSSVAAKKLAENGGFVAQTDDMAQMIGGKLRSVPNVENNILKALAKQDAVLVKGEGAFIKADEDDDAEALAMLVKKAAIAKCYTEGCRKQIKLSGFDCKLMRTVYKLKYSKKK